MTQYVLEILDGDRAGEVVALTQDRVSIGRKPTNTLPLKDEKASGNHAEVVFEDGRYVLRDLGSTNGTLMDGKRVEEVALSAQDVFQVGRVHFLFRSAEAASGGQSGKVPGGKVTAGKSGAGPDDLQLHTVDLARLKSSGKRRSVAGLLGLLVVLMGGGGYLWYRQNLAPNAPSKADNSPPRDSANLLKAGEDSCETEAGWDLRAGGAAFALGSAAKTGQSALEATWAKAEVQPGKPSVAAKAETFALARLKEPINVLPGESLELIGHLRTSGAGKGCVRLRFSSGETEDAIVLTTGAPAASAASWTEQRLALAVPPTLGKVQVELLAVLPGDGASVAFDDLVLKKGGGQKPIDLAHQKGAVLLGSGSTFALRSAGKPAILSARATTESGEFAGLAARGGLALSDLKGASISASLTEAGFSVQASAGELGTAIGLALELPLEVASAGALVRVGDGPFAAQNGAFSAVACTQVLLGSAGRRLLFTVPEGTKVSGRTQNGAFVLELAPVGALAIATNFEAERQAAREALQQARTLDSQGKPKDALDQLRLVLERHPHDEQRASEAALLRNKVLGQLGESLGQIDSARKKAEFLGARRALQRASDDLAALVSSYGEQNIADKEQVQKMRTQLDESLQSLTQRDGEEQKQSLQALQEVLKRSGMESLAGCVEDYLKRRFQ